MTRQRSTLARLPPRRASHWACGIPNPRGEARPPESRTADRWLGTSPREQRPALAQPRAFAPSLRTQPPQSVLQPSATHAQHRSLRRRDTQVWRHSETQFLLGACEAPLVNQDLPPAVVSPSEALDRRASHSCPQPGSDFAHSHGRGPHSREIGDEQGQ